MKLVRISAVWCVSCIITNKVWLSLKDKYKDYEYIELDYDMDDIEKYNTGDLLPVIIIFKEGIEVKRIIGETTLTDIEKILGEI